MLDEQQIEARQPLWDALSTLWLDTEVTDQDREWIARVMADSGLTIAELWHVYSVEVAPVVFMNRYSYAGQWAGFNPEWLRREILRNLRDRPRRTRFWASFPLTRYLMIGPAQDDWKKVIALFRRRCI